MTMRIGFISPHPVALDWAVAIAEGENPLKIIAACDEKHARILASALTDCGVSAIAFKNFLGVPHEQGL